jgi:predicted RecB family nuclease
VLPVPSVPELYPHARNIRDQPWHTAKARITEVLGELTLLPGMAPPRRRAAHAKGITRWDDPRTTAAGLEVENQYAGRCDAVIAINRDTPDLVVAPARIAVREGDWRTPAALELYVDFETVSNLADDFSRLPSVGGQPLIFQIGCGRWEDGAWRFDQWTVDRLNEADEAAMIDAWLKRMDRLRDERGLAASDLRVVHWSPAENSTLASAYNSAQRRHPEREWPSIPWFDFLSLVVRKEPVAVRGAFGFGLKGIVKGMHAAGLIETTWGDGPTDGLGAMIGAWWCDGEAARLEGRMLDLELMQEIARYNEVDCRSMAEVVRWLRANR